jgi:predicted transposase
MFVSLQFKLELRKEDKEKLMKLMRKQSSAIRVAYNMLRGVEKEKAKNPHSQIYHRLRQLFPELPTKYIDSAIYKAKQYPTDKPVVFGGKRLFEKLCKNHLTGKVREGLKKQWREIRQGTLISIGSKADKGNRLARFEDLNGQLYIRITTGNREFIYAKVLREPSNSKDKRERSNSHRHQCIAHPFSHSRGIKDWRTAKLSNHQPTPPFRTLPKHQRPPRVDISPQDSRFSHSEKQSYSYRKPKET